ncbi:MULTISPECIES: DUF460 domain-containing protein [Metallosphaera]|uniref:DUF460 domain-containing protein n=3 Tax=Metallosphaera TaxID=41980 RepID=A4YDA7_METS5|nr:MULTISPECIES: DUF460 domain-containing protein [Metallosphaera]ABP94409.1 protein of unknown function DUF460 [Metallosphaera sedula DSM 5348]AIM26396.1 protein of unknown function DUF460 [Metallosphaera sedula]AKV73399.1 hypothetical protein MsedA_0242 [Metallosphaera sedula]AKV75643.1 hypothetical protein MsedB_0242 [Metallosphaera sedula]AKV77889.1 hypothetical protein MsedC_0241 [Metallosphaera sedula]
MRVMGIDIERGSPNSTEQPRYSVVILDENGETVVKVEDVTRSRLVRLAWEYDVSLLGTDNIYELGSNDKEVISLLSLLPEKLEVVQVTVKNGVFLDLKDVAKEYGIEIQGKPTPSRTAFIVATLALKGAGTKIKFVENRTKIIISKGRRSGPGGMSSNRYKRHLRGLVLRVFRRVKEELDRHNFDYDVVVRRTKAGMEGAMFIVYAPRESLYGLVKKMSGHDVNLEIRAYYRDRIEFVDTKRVSQRPVIVGLDPGLEVGISILDMYGNPVLLTTKRGIDRESVIELVLEKGTPALIATDVNPVPDTVKKMSAILKARLYVPERSLSVDEKQALLDEYSTKFGIHVSDPHIRDSLAAAIVAYRDVERKLRQAEGMIGRFGIDIDRNNVFRCVVNGGTIAECIENEIEKKISVPQNAGIVKQEVKTEHNEKLAEENTLLKQELIRLNRTVSRLIHEKEMLERRVEEIKRLYNAELDRDRRVEELKRILEQKNKEIIKLKELSQAESESLAKLSSIIEKLVKNEVTVVRGYLKGLEVRDGQLYFGEWRISNDLAEYVGRDFALIDERLIKDLNLLKKEKEISREMSEDLLKRLVEEYRSSRSRIA